MIDIHRVSAAQVPDVSAKRVLPHALIQMAQQLAANGDRLMPGILPRDFAPPIKPDRTDDLIAASLAGGVIAASGRAHTAEEAVAVWREVRAALMSPKGGRAVEADSADGAE